MILCTVSERSLRNPITWKLNNDKKPRSCEECLFTFQSESVDTPVSIESLAAAGFYWLGRESVVKCFVCDLVVFDWKFGMTAIDTHAERSPTCRLVQAIKTCHHANFDATNEAWRLETFSNIAQNESQLKDHVRELAACGFYYLSSQNQILCAFCNQSIEIPTEESIMSKHRSFVKEKIRKKPVRINAKQYVVWIDCAMVRANCWANLPIHSNRTSFPEHPNFQDEKERRKSFDNNESRIRLTEKKIEEMAAAGYFYAS